MEALEQHKADESECGRIKYIDWTPAWPMCFEGWNIVKSDSFSIQQMRQWNNKKP